MMGTAFEITQDDVAIVLMKHGKVTTIDDPLIEQAFDLLDVERAEDAALCYDNVDDQTASALDEIEDMLIEEGVIQATKWYAAP